MIASSHSASSATPERLSLAAALAAARETRALHLASRAVRETGGVFRAQFPGARAVIVADRCTHVIAGKIVEDALRDAGAKSGFTEVLPVVELRGLCDACA